MYTVEVGRRYTRIGTAQVLNMPLSLFLLTITIIIIIIITIVIALVHFSILPSSAYNPPTHTRARASPHYLHFEPHLLQARRGLRLSLLHHTTTTATTSSSGSGSGRGRSRGGGGGSVQVCRVVGSTTAALLGVRPPCPRPRLARTPSV